MRMFLHDATAFTILREMEAKSVEREFTRNLDPCFLPHTDVQGASEGKRRSATQRSRATNDGLAILSFSIIFTCIDQRCFGIRLAVGAFSGLKEGRKSASCID